MIEYKVEYMSGTNDGIPLFSGTKYVNGKYEKTLINYKSASKCHAYIKSVIEGEGSYIVVPKTVKTIIFE